MRYEHGGLCRTGRGDIGMGGGGAQKVCCSRRWRNGNWAALERRKPKTGEFSGNLTQEVYGTFVTKGVLKSRKDHKGGAYLVSIRLRNGM